MRIAQLGDVASIIRGISFPKEDKRHAPQTDLVACLRTTNVQREVEWDDLWFVPAVHVKRGEQYVRPGDILISTANSYELVGKVAPVSHMPHKATLGAFISLIRPSETIDPKFLYHQLAWNKTQARIRQTASTTTNISNVSTKKLLTLELFVPSVAEQRSIVAEIEKQLSRLDEAVANLQRVKANLKRYKASVLKAAVEGRLVETEADLARREGRSYETGEQLLQRILEARRSQWKGRGKYKAPVSPSIEGLGSLPEGWTWTTADQMNFLITSGSRGWGDFYSDAGVLFIRAQDIKTDVLNLPDVARVNVPSDAEGTRSGVEEGDILITITGANVTKSALVPALGEKAFVSQHVALLKPCVSETAEFAFFWVISPANGRKMLESWAYGAGKPGLSLEQVRSLPIALPPQTEQIRIVAEVDRRLSIVREVEAEVDANLKRAQVLRQSVLQRAFSGGMTFRDAESRAEGTELSSTGNVLRTEPVSVVMAAKIMAANCDAPTFGRVKLQKMMYLAAHHGKIDAANGKYVRMQAGPLDMPMLEGVTRRLSDLHWFRQVERPGKSSKYKAYSYERLTKAGDYKQHLGALTQDQIQVIDDLNRLMRDWSSEECELFATVYAAWNDLILWKRSPSADAIISQVLENWHESKKKFSRERISETIDTITRLGYAPTGWGRPTDGEIGDDLSGDLFGSRAE